LIDGLVKPDQVITAKVIAKTKKAISSAANKVVDFVLPQAEPQFALAA
jgi:hypothetical protein|tara:strand:- start:350 stop:493 length:144 start_codon:yes stop_codon:yes gene_type:complete